MSETSNQNIIDKSNDNIASGTMFIAFAKVFWLFAGYAITFTLPRLISVDTYGVYGVVSGAMNVLNMVVIMGTLQGVSKFVSADEKNAKAIHFLSLKVLLLLGGSLTLVYFLLSTFGIIGDFLNDPSLTPYLQMTALITFFYSFYSVNVGYLNGKREFKKQAFLDMFFVSFKAICMLSFAWFGINYLKTNGLLETIGGFAFAAFVVLILSFFVIKFKFEKTTSPYTLSEVSKFVISIMSFTFILNLLMNTDLFLVKKLTLENTDQQVGYYTGALTISRIPYSLMMTVSLIIFPLISKVTSIGDKERTKRYIENALKYPFILLLGCAVVISSNSDLIIKIILGQKYISPAPTGEVLSVLVFAVTGLAIFTLSTSIISGSGKPAVSLGIGVIALLIDIAINWAFIPKYGLLGGAYSKGVSLTIAVLICLVYLYKKHNSSLPILTFIRGIGVAALTVYLADLYIPVGIVDGFIKLALVGIVFFIFIFLTQEFKVKEILALRK
ncbi:MAG: hypothetical protein DWQ06_00425 [Calditrichaeota bacterium]|nr:MAG: hypothetical protein DWQ06_00425 [Calditrichota bacterium]